LTRHSLIKMKSCQTSTTSIKKEKKQRTGVILSWHHLSL